MNEIEEARADYRQALWNERTAGKVAEVVPATERLIRAVMAEASATSVYRPDESLVSGPKSPPVSEPAAQGRAFKVGDRVRHLSSGETGFIVKLGSPESGEALFQPYGYDGLLQTWWPDKAFELINPTPSLTGELVKALEAARDVIRDMTNPAKVWAFADHARGTRVLSNIDALLTRAEGNQP